MRCRVQTILYVTLAAALGSNAFAQRGFGGPGGAARPSSTAQGAGALTGGRAAFPSSTAIGAGVPAVGFSGFNRGTSGYSSGGYSNGGYYGNRNDGTSRSGHGGRGRGDYRRLSSGYFLAPYYYPFLDYGSAPYGGGPQELPDNPDAALMDQNALGEQLRLGDQVQRLAAEVDRLKYGSQGPSQTFVPNAPGAADPPPPPTVPITVILRNGQKLQVQNYAVMDQTFWDFSKQPVRKIPVSSIDIAASSQATAASGAEFPQITPMP